MKFSTIVWVSGLLLVACGEAPTEELEQAEQQADVVAAQAPQGLTSRQSQMWTRSCALCHVDGNAMAPRLGHPAQWQERLARGREQLLAHTIEGFNDMPALGYCMACEREDFLAMIEFMAGQRLTEVTP